MGDKYTDERDKREPNSSPKQTYLISFKSGTIEQ